MELGGCGQVVLEQGLAAPFVAPALEFTRMSYPPPYDPNQQPGQGFPHQPAYPPPQAYQPPGFPPAVAPGQPPAGYPLPPAPKKSNTGRIVAAGVAGVLLFCGGGLGLALLTDDGDSGSPNTTVAAPTRAEPESPEAAPLAAEEGEDAETFGVKVGSTITHTDGGDVQTAVLKSVKTFKSGCNSLDVDPQQAMYVVVELVVTQKKGTGSVNPLDFTFVADDGTTANALSGTFSGCDEPALGSTNSLRAGQKRAGKIAFDAGMKAGTVEWAPGGLLGSAVGSWATK